MCFMNVGGGHSLLCVRHPINWVERRDIFFILLSFQMLHVRTLHNHIVPCTLEVCTQYEKETHFKRRFISCDLDVRVCKNLYVSYVKLFFRHEKAKIFERKKILKKWKRREFGQKLSNFCFSCLNSHQGYNK